jgi:DNA modification methylase
MGINTFSDGCVIHGSWPDVQPIVATMGPYPLVVADPPYGDIKRHPCEKPRRLIEIILETSSNPGDVVLDPFAGSGVTADACRALGRYFILIEQDLVTYETICKSLQ